MSIDFKKIPRNKVFYVADEFGLYAGMIYDSDSNVIRTRFVGSLDDAKKEPFVEIEDPNIIHNHRWDVIFE